VAFVGDEETNCAEDEEDDAQSLGLLRCHEVSEAEGIYGGNEN
jgi:hypothetical protein